jgi:Uncharacterized protein conserved in bacteria (DUF2184)
MQASRVVSHVSARNAELMQEKIGRMFKASDYKDLSQLGIGLDSRAVNKMMQGYATAMDALQPLVTTASVNTPVQFLQNWLPGFVFVITAARKIDDLIGIQITGAWEDEQIVQGVLERTGTSVPYGDWTNVPLSSWNTNFVTRTVVRGEEGMKVGNLEAARSARMLVDDSGMKRESCALALEIFRNEVGFYGFNDGANNTYGFLNDPGLNAYTEVAEGAASSTLWSHKTFLEIQKDILTAIVTLRTQSEDIIDPEKVDLTLAVATDAVDYLATTSDFGISVRDWLRQAYPRIRVVSAPQLNDADTVDDVAYNVFYLYADKIQDMSTDGGSVWIQAVPAKFQVMGVQQLAKAYEEDYSNATAGAMAKRPWAITRWYGI